MSEQADILIAGGGLAALRTAQELRDVGHTGGVVMMSDEPHLPYDRPPLSKDYLLGKVDEEKVRLVTEEQLAEIDVELRRDTPARGLDRDGRRVLLDDGEVGYDRLVVATGARPTTLPMLEGFSNAMILRSLDESRGLRSALEDGPSVAIVGGGFIGLEVAAAARHHGCDVVVIEAAEAPLGMVLGSELGRHIQRFHEQQGVAFHCGSMLARAHGEGRVDELELEDGWRTAPDIVVVAVGPTANTDWLADSGLELHLGLVCDARGRTDDPNVFGAGDAVCRHFDGECHQVGHWTAAGDHARAVASVVCDEEPGPTLEDNYFWSDQFDARMQFVGVVPPNPRITYAAGDPEEDSFVALCSDDQHVTAVLGMNNTRDFIKQSMPLRQGETVPAPD